MPLTVRLPEPMQLALENYCSSHGLTKSEFVQQSIAEHLRRVSDAAKGAVRTPARQPVSAAFASFKRAGLIGAVSLGKTSATKQVVRKRMTQRPSVKP